MNVAIAGGGIGGLTAALACRRAGLEVAVTEQSTAPEQAGAGIQLAPNAVRVLHALGLADPLAQVAFAPLSADLRHWRSGRLLARMPLGETVARRHGVPYYHVHRQDLHGLLLKAVRAVGVEPVLGTRCVGVRQDPDGAALVLADGGELTADVGVGADGIRSAVRDALLGELRPRFTGNVAWRGLIATEQLGPDLVQPAATVWVGPGAHFVHYRVSGGRQVNYVAIVEAADWTDESWVVPGEHRDLLAAFDGWHPNVHALILATDACFKWALHDRDPLERWSDGRVTLLGDACHPMLPFLAQGAAMAIEDAWVLAASLKAGPDPATALARYEHLRRPRATRVQLGARAQGRMFHLASPWRRALRDTKLAIGGRLFPTLSLRHYDWLFGHDATATDAS